jgi:gliding motility-associated-like protein
LLSKAQTNLAPNPGFEEYTSCPTGLWQFNCYPWHSGSGGSPDYFNACTNSNVIGVPDNFNGSQPALSGNGYTGFVGIALQHDEFREYIQAYLESTLIGGKWYYVSFNLSLSGGLHWSGVSDDCGIEQIGAYFSAEPPDYVPVDFIDVVPQVESSGSFYSDTTNWMLIEGCFKAVGDEMVITIGNFHNNLNTNVDTACTAYPYEAYYYLEDVFVGEVQPGELDLELGGPVSGCYTYTIDPQISGVDFYWEGGSTDPTLTVTTSGMYSLTIYDGCRAGVDSIEVIIINAPDDLIDLEEITVCQGETVEVTLDPDLTEYTWNDGSHETDYVIATSGVYTVTLDDGCDITIDEIEVTILDPPSPFSLGGDTVLCTGSQIEFEFDPDLGDFQWQDNNPSNYYVITQEGFYAVTISNMCGEASAELEVTETDPVIVSLGVDNDTLCTGEMLHFSLDPALGTYIWQDGSTNPIYNISSTGVYSVTMTNYCGLSSDTVAVVAYSTPSFDLGDTIHTCPGQSWTIAITNYIGEYTWQDGSHANYIEVTTSGTYSLTIENACGIDSGDIVMIYADTLLPPDLGADFSLCPGDVATLNVSFPGATYIWQDMSTADTLLVNVPGIYHVQVSNQCETLMDTVVVTTEDQPPSISLPDQISLCQGSNEVLDPEVSGVVYTWSDGTDGSTLNVTSPGVFMLTVTNACGSDVDTVIVLNGGPLPSVSLGPDVSICEGEVINITPVFSDVNSWLWSDGSMNAEYSSSSAGTVYVEVTNGCGVAYDTMEVNILAVTPPLDLGPDFTLCPGMTSILMITISDVNVLWSDSTTGNNFLVTETDAQVYATITNGCGESVDTVNVLLLPTIPPLDLGADQSLCPGEVISFDPGIAEVNYLWQDGSTGSSFQTTQQLTVILTISNACGTTSDTVVVTESSDGPQVDLGPDIFACEGETITIPAGISGVDYLWQDGSGADVYVATTAGWVHLTVSNLCGIDTDSVLVDISGVAPAPSLGPDTTLCEGTSLTLVSHADAFTSIEWQDGSSGQNFLITAPGTYSLTESNQCGIGSDEILVTYTPFPTTFSLGYDTTLCPGESMMLVAPETTDMIRWQNGSEQSYILANEPGTYSLEISNACGINTDEIVVDFNADLAQLAFASPMHWCPGDQITLNAEQTFIAHYEWSTGQNESTIVVTTPGFYTVNVFALCNSVTGHVEVAAFDDCRDGYDIYFPNVFSPNGDLVNDVFTLSASSDIQLTDIKGSIYDRWGNMVYSSNVIPFAWDGRFGGEVVMAGVYVYHVKLVYTVGGVEKDEVVTGDVTVIR